MKTNRKLLLVVLLATITTTKAQNTNTFPASGNVGIGTTSPWANFQVNSSDRAFVSISGQAPGVVFSDSFLNTHHLPAIGLSTTTGHYFDNAISGQFNIRGGIGGDIVFGNLLNNESNGQEFMRLKSNGNLGLGTNNPVEKLDINGNIKFNNTLTTTGRMHISGGEKLYILNKDGVNISKAWGGTGDLEVEGTISMANNALIQGSGRMHVNGAEALYLLNKEGVTVSKAWGGTGNLQVEGKIGVGSSIDFVQSTYGSGFGTRITGADYGNGKTSLNFDVRANSSTWTTAFKIGSNSNLFIKENLGIGTENPDQKLTVKGKIHSEEVIVDLQVPADYVFEKYYKGTSILKPDYELPTLTEVEKYTKENNHLPNMPSAKEIQEKGLQVGQMTNLLLQKIEELTLYLIEQQKMLELQNKSIELFKIQNQQQQNRIALLENKLK